MTGAVAFHQSHHPWCVPSLEACVDCPSGLTIASGVPAPSAVLQALPGTVDVVRGVSSITRRPAEGLSCCRTCALLSVSVAIGPCMAETCVLEVAPTVDDCDRT